MAKNTTNNLLQSMIYQVFVRNHTEEGTFKGLTQDLDRIKELGTDILYLLPIHPIGKTMRKGALGSPYAISNYREINEEYGTLEDFKQLIQETHNRGMKLMIDVVYNHTSPDSHLSVTHPEWFYKKEDGNFGNKVGDWWDIIDLDFNQPALWDELIDTLKYWSSVGVDGFRCDVAPLLPIDFWLRARKEVAEINPDTIWLAESIEPHFISYLRSIKQIAHCDAEVFSAFDISYDYDVYPQFKGYLQGNNTLEEYLQALRIQEYIYPSNYIKLHFLENHDQDRIMHLVEDESLVYQWTAFSFFNKGCAFVYAGQEAFEAHRPSLFDLDPVNFDSLSQHYSDFISQLANIKKLPIITNHEYFKINKHNKEVISAIYEQNDHGLMGIFNVGKENGTIQINIEDGTYTNLFNNQTFTVENSTYTLTNEPVIFECSLIKKEIHLF